MNAALADAAWLTGLERNSDIVIMAAYAPLFVNVNPTASQWGTNLIGYDSFTAYGSPSYWMQVMFGSAIGTEVVDAKLTGADGGESSAAEKVFTSVTRDAAKGKLYVKLVNTSSDTRPVQVSMGGAGLSGVLTQLSAMSPTDTNSITQPMRITPKTSKVVGFGSAALRLPPYSVSVYALDTK